MAEILNGRQYGEEISKEQAEVAKASGLIVVFGSSDDIVITKGFIDDELYLSDEWDSTIWNFTKDWKLVMDFDNLFDWEIDNTDINWDTKKILMDFYKKFIKTTAEFTAEFEKNWYSWFIDSSSKHETFEIFEDWEKFCRGIVININDL